MSDVAATVDELRNDREHGASWMARRAVEALLDTSSRPAGGLLGRADRKARDLGASARREQAGSRRDRRRHRAAARGRERSPLPRARRAPPADRRGGRRDPRRTPPGRRLNRDPASGPAQGRSRPHALGLGDRPRGARPHEPARAICTVSEPIGEGRAFAEELRGEGLTVDLIEDADAPAALAEATVFFLGADTVFRDGTLCNKIGTTAIAEAAHARNVPTVVACEIVKLRPIDAGGRAGSERGRACPLRAHASRIDRRDRDRGRHCQPGRGRPARRQDAVPPRGVRTTPSDERSLVRIAILAVVAFAVAGCGEKATQSRHRP